MRFVPFAVFSVWWPSLPAVACVVAAMGFSFAGCNRASCDGLHTPSLSVEAPVLNLVEMLDSQTNNPWGLVFALSFSGGAGHVADGNLLIYTGASAPAVLPLQNAFASSSLSFDATSGRVAVPLTISQGGVEDDAIVRLGFQLQDAVGLYSNCYTLDIHVDISVSAQHVPVPRNVIRHGPCPAHRPGHFSHRTPMAWMRP